LAQDEWERDPGVLFMRRVFSAIEARQAELLERLNVLRTDRGLRSARKMALQLFERTRADAADRRVRLGEEDALRALPRKGTAYEGHNGACRDPSGK
jgi:hypothetical protein